jgi:glycosyltransferase involved in cell wall biosynthesis
MNKISTGNNIRILTDISIRRSPLWNANTHFIGDLKIKKARKNSKNAFERSLSNLLLPCFNVIKILKNHKNYDVVITANLRTAQLYGLCRRIFRLRSPKQVVLELMLDEEHKSVLWKLKRIMQRFAFSSVDIIFVSATHEIDTYSQRLNKPKKHIKFLPFHTNVMEPRIMKGGGYIISAGRTGRDYGILADAVKDMDLEVIIISDEQSVQGINFPSNVTVLVEVPYQEYLNLLYNCRFVVMPLKKLVKSTGQVAFLEAMATGKPVIATEAVGTKDYIQSGVNGILIPPEDPGSLREAICALMKDPTLEKKISMNALESVRNLYTLEKYCSTILNEVEELLKI